MAKKWFFSINGIEAGPVDDEVLISLVGRNKINKRTPVKYGASGNWQLANDIEGLFDEGPETPPPVGIAAKPDSSTQTQTITFDYGGLDDDVLTCPHCWTKFTLDKIHYISRHPSMMGDPVAGEQENLRFLPSVFTEDGHAIDAGGEICPDMACPNCHLRIPVSIIDLDSMFFSIIGAPSSGKSYFLTAMTWKLRRELPEFFDLAISDSDTVTNQVINEYERLLFLNSDPEKVIALPKTDERGAGFTNQVKLNDMDIPVDLPLPFIFTLRPTDAHHNAGADEDKYLRNLVLYDNAGEHFQPGRDTVQSPGTKHMVHSDGLIFLFDPVCDARMRSKCNHNDPQIQMLKEKICNQETLLAEMIGRIRRYKGCSSKEKMQIPLIICVTKHDMWKDLLLDQIEKIPLWDYNEKEMIYQVNFPRILNVSYHVREVLREFSPEIVATAESFTDNVFYAPVSALGCLSEQNEQKSFLGVSPANINPVWATAPILILLSLKNYIPVSREDNSFDDFEQIAVETHRKVKGSVIFSLKGHQERIQLPSAYAGVSLYHPKLEKWFTVP